MKKVYFLLFILFGSIPVFSQTLFDSFSDNDFTINPVWSGNTSDWQILQSSDVSGGAANSLTLHLAAQNPTGTSFLSSPIYNWSLNQEWGIFIGRRSIPATAADQSYFWLYANEADLNSPTVDGYRISFGDDLPGDHIRLEYIVDGAVNSTVITSTGTTANGIINFGFLVRVTRSSSGAWQLFTSVLPQASATGALATTIPNATNAAVSQGTGTNNAILPATNGYIGIAALHSPVGIYVQEFDQVYFTASPVNTPVITVTPTEIHNFYTIGTTPSAAQSYIVQGTDLTSDLLVSTYMSGFPLTNFEASLTETPFVPNPMIHLTPIAGTVAPTPIYIRLHSVYHGLVYEFMLNSSTGAQQKSVIGYGNVLAVEPTAQSNISFGTSTSNSIVVNFSGGNGNRRLVLAKASTTVDGVPQDGVSYWAQPAFGSGDQLGAGNFVVYSGTGNAVLVTGLTQGTTYYFAVFEYNKDNLTVFPYTAADGSENYLLPGNPANQTVPFSPLAISIDYFNGIKQNGKHLLNWKVSCNNTPKATMTVERNVDSHNFTGIYIITADAVRCSQPFEFTDADPLTGINYYRLKMVDADGKTSYSKIIALINGANGFALLNISPNPVTGNSFELNATAAAQTKMEVLVSDLMGRIVQRQTVVLAAGINSIAMNVAKLPPGTYNISATAADDRSTLLRFVKE